MNINEEYEKELEKKNRQIQTLKNKLDSHDVILADYKLLKDKNILLKNEIMELKTKIENLNSNKLTLEFEIKKMNIEKENYLNEINSLKDELKEMKIKSNSLFNNKNKIENEINDYKKREVMFGNVQIENQTLNTKIETLNNIQNKKDKTIYELRDINNKINLEKINILKQYEENKNKLLIITKRFNEIDTLYKNERKKNDELLEFNKILKEEKIKLFNENNYITKELNGLKSNFDIINKENKKLQKEVDEKSRIYSEIKIKKEELEKENEELKKQNIKNKEIIDKENNLKINYSKLEEEMNNKLNIYEANNIELKNKLIKYEHDINYLKIKNQELEKNNNDINYKFESLNIELEKRKDKNVKLEDEIMIIKNYQKK